ncbi:PadR family transcriptional regulator [Amycolatopsis regifaucium]|uniref:PadR family transcriptional regulator n=1 Tax=Amycolatopsis regifaucium TaxID=546365 RepID=A0A154M9I3_9PSEU|nr:PadR family transcriptional regulator [Amycolatopsis regifaucium]KZB80459.1 PadR family transcriptional regulator [Amycolatopsis regifaucium]OKA05429.1 PadR family transcriptional regulator [Amycolatopsis regifaucium]SFJ05712.1 DNA-binding transcriptional regulator, PadR family [Amycolatopsis regifaucium]
MRGRPFPPEHGRPAFGPWARGGFGEFPPPPGWGPGGPGHRHRHGRRGGPGGRRGKRGDVRAAILALLSEQPRHGYEIIREIGERSGGFWKPSPGSVYPTLQMLADEGLVISKDESGKKLFELTESGRAAAQQQDAVPPWEQIAHDVDPVEVNLRKAGATLAAAVMQVMHAGSEAQQSRAVDVLNEARRTIYGILGEADDDTTPDGASPEDAE